MRLIQQTLTKQKVMTTTRADLGAMGSEMTNKTTASNEEQIRVII
jgi:hypothetical protein